MKSIQYLRHDSKKVFDKMYSSLRSPTSRSKPKKFFNKVYQSFRSESHTPKVKPGELPHHVMFVKPFSKTFPYRVFCGGSIVTIRRVLSLSTCFVTHQKRHKHDNSQIRVVAGLLQTTATGDPGNEEVQQWRTIKKIHTQKYFRASYDLAVVVMNKNWTFNTHVNKIPYASLNQNFDGVCTSVTLKATSSWDLTKFVYIQERHFIERKSCENTMLYSCRLFYCTVNKGHADAYREVAGSGLICRNTGDPEEVSEEQGLLVGVTSEINIGLPSLYSRIALFNKWVTDSCEKFRDEVLLVFMSFVVINFIVH